MKALIVGSTTVLADTTQLEWSALNDILKKYGRPARWSLETFRQLKATGTVQTALQEVYSTLVLNRVFPEMTRVFQDRIESLGILARPATVSLINEATQHGIAVAIASDEDRTTLNLIRAGALNFRASQFALTVAAEEMLHRKPHPAAYLRVADVLNVSPSETATLEASQTGVDAALAAGMVPYTLPGFESLGLKGAAPLEHLRADITVQAPQHALAIAAE